MVYFLINLWYCGYTRKREHAMKTETPKSRTGITPRVSPNYSRRMTGYILTRLDTEVAGRAL